MNGLNAAACGSPMFRLLSSVFNEAVPFGSAFGRSGEAAAGTRLIAVAASGQTG